MRSNLQRLMQLYLVLLTVMVVTATGLITASNVINYKKEMAQTERLAVQRLTDTLTRYQEVTDDFIVHLTADPQTMDNINQYFTQTPEAYAEYVIDHGRGDQPYFSWPKESTRFLQQHPDVSRLELALGSNKRLFVATQEKKEGQLAPRRPMTATAFMGSLGSDVTSVDAGAVGVTFNPAAIQAKLNQLRSRAHMQLLVLTPQGLLMNHYRDDSVTGQEYNQVKSALKQNRLERLTGFAQRTVTLPNEYQVLVLVNTRGLDNLLFKRVLPIAFAGLVLLFLLSGLLVLTFRQYQRQLKAIITTVTQVGNGDLAAKVAPVPDRHSDLKALQVGINTMLDDINQYIYTIYQLKIAQQEADMKALQSQINPHFMSNTLEYIRMAALDADQPELAKVVFSFAALLRNNTDQSPMTTLSQELNFIEKYIYLYQVRFPDRLAYQVQLEDDLKQLPLPKFSLQPLVENYFVHGIDWTRHDNLIVIKARRVADTVAISVINNGRPLSMAELSKLNLAMTEPLDDHKRNSIGLQNVYARLASHLGASFHMRLQQNSLGGVSTKLTWTEERKDL